MGAALKKDYPQVEEYTRIFNSGGGKFIKKNNEYFNEQNVLHADSTIFNVFTFVTITGDTRTALNEPNTVVITRSTALKYYGTTDAVGKMLETNDDSSTVYKVTAVIEDIPSSSHFTTDFIFSMDNVEYDWGNYLSHNFYTYLLLRVDTDPKEFEKKFGEYINTYVLPQASHVMNINSLEEFEKAGNQLKYSIMPVTKIHLNSDRSFDLSPAGNIQYIYIFSAVALFILLIACINFMNLTTARSASRAREVGIRKVLGTERRNLVLQFLSESTFMAVLSMAIAVAITYLVLPFFNNLASKSLSFEEIFSGKLLIFLAALPFVVGIIAGSYPAFYLSSFRPIQVLKGIMARGGKAAGLRSTLVVFQFWISIILIMGTIVVYRQLNYIQTKNLGFNKDQVVIVNDAYSLSNNIAAFRNEMLNSPGVSSATMSGFLPIPSSRNDNTFSKEADINAKNGFSMQVWTVDEEYLETLGMEMNSGRFLSKDFGSDSSAVVVNEACARILGYDEPIGKKIYTLSGPGNDQVISYNIIGVVKDFHYESLRRSIRPLCMVLGSNNWLASFRVSADQIPGFLDKAKASWKVMAPKVPFSYRFMDESFDSMYRAEQRVGKIAMIFAILAILIACLGLFGLTTFIAEQRTREIGIRKVLGASVNGIIQLLSREFLKLVIISFIIAIPVAWWLMNKWLEDFAYRVTIGWWMFAVAGIIALLIAVFTVSFQSIKAAIANPVKSLRTE
jgi:putative ABC transport system permease protein